MRNEQWVVFIDWDSRHCSPPIGPFDSHSEANRAQTEIRKRLRANGKRWQGMVRTHQIRDIWAVRAWLPLSEDLPYDAVVDQLDERIEIA